MAQSFLSTLGTFALRAGATHVEPPATQKARAILAFLALNRDTDVSRERLLELFWPEMDPDRGRDSLRTALWSIRRCLKSAGLDADAFLSANRSVVRWSADTVVDTEEFERLAAGAGADLGLALSTYKGDFLEGDYEDWVVAERERLASAFEAALGKSLRILPDAQVAQRLLARNPYDEDAYATLIEAELAAGRRMAAIAYVERCRSAFREIGAVPSDSFERRFGAIGRMAAAPAAHLQLPFVGREAELTAIAAMLDASERSVGSVIIVHGEAGIGKSTVLTTATRMASSRGLRILAVQCDDGDSRMFGPWPQIFEGVTGDDFAALARTSGAAIDVAYAEAMAARLVQPTLLVVDDAHALRGEALGMLGALIEAIGKRHACIVGTRPEGVSALRGRFADVAFDEITLRALHRSELETAFAQLTGEPTNAIFDALFERTGGHPLFFSALLAMLATSGVVKQEGYRWRFASDAATSLELPPSLRRYIEMRLNACGEDARAAACALALEPAATTDDLIGALGRPDELVLDALDELLARGLIVEPPVGPQFAFSHGIIGEVAAKLLNAGRRGRLHRAFAEQLKRTQAQDRWLRLARHLRAAGEPLEAGAAYHDAALEALEWSAFGDVVARAAEGVATVERLDRSPERDAILALLKRAESGGHAFGGDAVRAVAPADEAVAYARASGDRRVLLRTLLARGFAESESGDLTKQRDDAREAVEIARELDDDVMLAKALVQFSTASTPLGDAERALAALNEAYGTAVRREEWGLAEAALGELVFAHIASRRFADALHASNLGLEAARRSEPSALATAHFNRAGVWYVVDRFEDGLRDLAAASSLFSVSAGTQERWGRGGIAGPTMLYAISYLRGLIEARLGRWDAAIACLDAIRQDAPRVIDSRRYGCAHRMLAIDVLLRRGAPGDGETAAAEAALLPTDLDSIGVVGWADAPALARARVAVSQGRSDAADRLRAALTCLEERARIMPLDVDRWFAVLADAATLAGCAEVATAAAGHASRHFRARRDAAGSLWGGQMGEEQ